MKAVTLRQNGVEHTLMAVERDDLKEGLEIWIAGVGGVLHGRILNYKSKTSFRPEVLEVRKAIIPLSNKEGQLYWTVFPGDEGVPGCAYDDRFPRIFLSEKEATLVVDEVRQWMLDWQAKHRYE